MKNYTAFLNDLNIKIQNKSNAIPVAARTFINQVLRNEVSNYDYISTIRRATTTESTPSSGITQYSLPSDMKSEALIDIQLNDKLNDASYIKYRKVSPNVFRTMRMSDTVAFDYDEGTSYLLTNIITDDDSDPIEIIYYSKYPWKTSLGSWQLDSTSNEDILNASETEYEVWLNKCAYEASKAIPLSTKQIQILRADYMDAKNNYANKYPSRRIKEMNYLYRPQDVNKKFIRLVKTGDVKNSL